MNATISFANIFSALAPVLVVGFASVLALLIIAFKRSHAIIAGLSVVSLVIAGGILISKLVAFHAPQQLMGLFIIDKFALFYMLLVVICAIVCVIYSIDYIRTYDNNREELYVLMLASVVGAMIMVASSHYASFFIGLETMSIPVYGMLAYTYQRQRSLESAIKYLVLSATASAMLLLGFAYVYAYTGSMNFVESGLKVMNSLHQPFVILGLALVLFACAFKLSLAPFHKWTPDVYQGAATPMVTFLASAAKVAMLGLFLRYVFTSSTLTFVGGLIFVAMIIAVLSMLFGNILAFKQNDFKRLLAYSSIAHFGYILAAIVSGKVDSLSAVTTYITVYALTTLGTFGVVSLLSSPYRENEADNLSFYQGLAWKNPVLAFALSVMMLSLAGVPMTAGFIAKFTVFMSIVSSGQWFLALMLIVGSGIGLYYYLRVMVSLYSKAPDSPEASQFQPIAIGRPTMLIIIVLALITLLFGVYPQPLLELTSSAGIAVPQMIRH